MGRRISTGRITGGSVGQLSINEGTIESVDSNQDITLDPDGTGSIIANATIELRSNSSLEYFDSDSSNYLSFKSPASLSSNTFYTWPDSDGSSNQCLTTNGSGGLTWTDKGFAVTNNNSAGESYVLFTSATTGSVTSANVANTGLVYTPNASTLELNGMLVDYRLETIATGNYTLAASDQNKVVTFTNASAASLTIPNDSTTNFPLGSIVYIYREGGGSVTLAPASGVTLSKLGSVAENEEFYLRKRSANNWVVVASEQPPSAGGGAESAASGYNIHTFTSGGTWTIG